MSVRDRAPSARTGSPAAVKRPATRRSALPASTAAPREKDTGRAGERPRARLLARLGMPRNLARLVWWAGVVSLLSAASPALHERLQLVTDVLPRVFPAAATTGTLAAGVALMLLAKGLRQGKQRAWLLATMLTAFATVTHLIKGLDVEEATFTGAVFLLLLTARHRFHALPDPRSPRRLAEVVVLGIPLTILLGFVWISVDLDGLAPGSSTITRLSEAALGLVGIRGPLAFVDPGAATRTSVGLAVLGAALLLVLAVVALEPAAGPHRLDVNDFDGVRGLLRRWGLVDSLSWFALREDRAVIFCASRKAAVSYRVVGGVSLAAGDPLGDPRAWANAVAAWLMEADAYGWVPGVLGASEKGAEAYHRAGLDALQIGDEAVLHTADFTTEGRRMRGVRQAVARCRRAGLYTTCCRVRDLDEAVRDAVVDSADAWRDGEVERGFSMALGRLADPEDEDAMMVLCRDAEGNLRGLLQMVPWGEDGLSLDVMRRDRSSENGIIELMVADLMARAEGLGVARVSLNFAVFRDVFTRGERLGAGPVLRGWRAILLQASRFWQIETLYRANAKFQPEWVPRFICFRYAVDLPGVTLAALRAEAFIVAPAWWRNLGERAQDRQRNRRTATDAPA